ncbi:MAG TPA: lysylphosphatidylglycerol synthase domain-containing protein [Albitalea sp.]|uniref:lysylphosphatidylglycerol synthase domain-containing protein n=1 Tax=Piscinibacter sp. TaxID=1903157 RepID=UPI002ECFD7F0
MSSTGTPEVEVREWQPQPTARPAWRVWLLRLLTLAFFIGMAALLAHVGRSLDWDTVVATLRAYRLRTLVTAATLALASYGVYAGFELAARRYSGHTLPPRLVAGVGAIAYSFNLNLGAWVGGIGFRYRLYSQLGLNAATTSRLYLSTLLTNWTGYLALGGAVFTLYGLDLPPQWELSDEGLRWIGLLMVIAAAAWLLACARLHGRSWTVRGHEVELPTLRLALVQMGLGASNWMLMGAVVYTLLPHVAPAPGYGAVLGTLLLACIAGVATHIPAGVGVLEAVFLALLGHRVPQSQLLGALLAYRAVYYLVPLVIAGVGYAWLEARLKRRR